MSDHMDKDIKARLGALALSTVVAAVVVSLVVLAHHHSTTSAPRAGGVASSAPSSSAARVTRVEIEVPNNGLTFQVARGTVLALHLHLRSGTPTSSWSAGSAFTGTGYAFAATQVPYPGSPPKESPVDYYVAYRIQGEGTAGLGIGIPSTCTGGELCPPQLEVITVHAVAPPIITATVTGELTRQCGPRCLGPAADATISFRNQAGRSVGGTKTDVFGDYVAELPPGTWQISTTPGPIHMERSTLTVGTGDILIDDVEVGH